MQGIAPHCRGHGFNLSGLNSTTAQVAFITAKIALIYPNRSVKKNVFYLLHFPTALQYTIVLPRKKESLISV